MSFSESVRTCMRKFFVTSGRASRSEFWGFQLFVFIMTFLIYGWTASNLIDEEIIILIDFFLFLILFIPFWRTLKKDGELNPKYPGGVEYQKEMLEKEGHSFFTKGRKNIRYFVENYEENLFKLE